MPESHQSQLVEKRAGCEIATKKAKKNRQMIEKLRNENPVENCEIKHYRDLDFVDIFENVDKTAKKKSVSNIDTRYYSVGYFKNNQLIRLDNVGAIPKETYVVWENGKVKEPHEFFLGIREVKRISNKEQIGSSWFYTYDNAMLKQIVWVNYEDRNYYSNGKMTITYDYQYDEKVCCLSTKQFQEKGILGKARHLYFIR